MFNQCSNQEIMNIECDGAINNQKLTTKVLLIEALFMDPNYKQFGGPSIHNFLFYSKAKIICVTVNYLIDFMTAGFTVPLRLAGVYIRTAKKKTYCKAAYIYTFNSFMHLKHIWDRFCIFNIF